MTSLTVAPVFDVSQTSILLPETFLVSLGTIATALSVAFLLSRRIGAWRSILCTSMVAALIDCAVWMVFSAPPTDRYLSLVVLAISAGMLATICGLKTFTACAIWLAAGESCFAIGQSMAGRDGFHSADLLRIGGSFGHPTQLATASAFVLPLAFWRSLRSRRLVDATLTSLIGVCLCMTWCRGPILGAALGCLVVLFGLRNALEPGWRVLISVGIVAFAVAPSFVRAASDERMASTLHSNQSRLAQAQDAASVLAKHPFGVGPTRISLSFPRTDRDGTIVQGVSHDPKNQFLALLLSFGIPGGIAALACLASTVATLRVALAEGTLGLVGATVSVAVLCQFDSPFFMQGHEVSSGILGMLVGSFVCLDRKVDQ